MEDDESDGHPGEPGKPGTSSSGGQGGEGGQGGKGGDTGGKGGKGGSGGAYGVPGESHPHAKNFFRRMGHDPILTSSQRDLLIFIAAFNTSVLVVSLALLGKLW